MHTRVFGVTFVGLALALSGCGETSTTSSEPEQPVAEQEVITLYSARHYDGDEAIYDAFEAATGIKVQARESRAPQLLETMRAEGDASPADVIIAADAGTLWRFKDAGLTQPVGSEILEEAIPAALRDPEGHWFGLAKRYRGIAYDTERVSPEAVDAFAKLADDSMEGEICARSSSNIYNLSLLGHLMETLGTETVEGWTETVANGLARDPAGGDTDQIRAVAAGACSVAITNHYYWVRLSTSASEADREVAGKTAFAFADAGDGPHVNVSAGAIAANAPNPVGAIAFLEFLASEEGQALLVAETKEYPILASVALPEGLATAPDVAPATNLARLGENQVEAQRIYDRAGWP
ncbi:MAG: extracellular solute-binding protein [Pseudomonadota bacterium]